MTSAIRSALVRLGAMTALAVALGPNVAFADDLGTFLSQGTVLIDARLRFESVDQTGFVRDASAATARLRAGYQTAIIWDLQALVELEATGHLSNAFNDTVNGHVTYPTVADPENFELNRAQLAYSGLPQTVVTLGRQRINLDDQRFIGASAFRQNEQTFDALRVTNVSIDNLTLNYMYVNRVNRVFTERGSQGHFSGDLHFLNAAYDWKPVGQLVAYAYLLDLHNAAALSTQTFGLSFSGKQPIGDDIAVSYRAETATQSAFGANPQNFSLDYFRGELGLSSGIYSALAGVEYLDGNGTVGFSTPLATLHKFQGTADAFLTTPVNGIVDGYGKIAIQLTELTWGPITGASLAGWYHGYASVHGGSLGSEFDLESKLNFDKHYAVSIAYATYDGVPGFASRNKIWLTVEVNY